MKGTRRALLRRAGAAAAASGLLMFGATAAQGAESNQITLATGYPESSFHVVNLHRFAKALEQASGGKIQLKIHAGSSLIKAADIRGALEQGTVDAAELFGPSLGQWHPSLSIDALPFVATDYPAAQKLANAARAQVRAQLENRGYILLYSVSWPPQGLFTNVLIESLADFHNLRIRENSPPVKRVVELLGGTPVRVETPELAAAVQNKKIDAVFTSAAQGMDTQIWRQLPYFYTADAWLPRNVVILRKKIFDELPPEQRELLVSSAAAAEVNGQKLSEENAVSMLDQLRRVGVKVDSLTPVVRRKVNRIGETLVREQAAAQKNADMLNILMAYYYSSK